MSDLWPAYPFKVITFDRSNWCQAYIIRYSNSTNDHIFRGIFLFVSCLYNSDSNRIRLVHCYTYVVKLDKIKYFVFPCRWEFKSSKSVVGLVYTRSSDILKHYCKTSSWPHDRHTHFHRRIFAGWLSSGKLGIINWHRCGEGRVAWEFHQLSCPGHWSKSSNENKSCMRVDKREFAWEFHQLSCPGQTRTRVAWELTSESLHESFINYINLL